MFSFLPDLIVGSVAELTPALLQEKKVDTLLLDFDNTLQAYSQSLLPVENGDWIASLQNAGIALCVVSNSRKSRAASVCETYHIPLILNAKKPFSRGIRQALALFTNREGVALVGDQIYTDVLGANRCGVTSILVTPIHLSNAWLKLRHIAELPWIAAAKRKASNCEKNS